MIRISAVKYISYFYVVLILERLAVFVKLFNSMKNGLSVCTRDSLINDVFARLWTRCVRSPV